MGFPPGDWPYPAPRPLTAMVDAAEFSRAPQEAPLTLKIAVGVKPTTLHGNTVGFYGIDVAYVTAGRRRLSTSPCAGARRDRAVPCAGRGAAGAGTLAAGTTPQP